jgi:hypothetical protein
MKTYLQHKKAAVAKSLFAAFAAVAIGAVCASCDNIVDYDEGYTPADKVANAGAPVITAVYNVSDTAFLSPITEAETGVMVRLAGKNLNNVKRVAFNTVSVGASDIYTFSTGANVRIPETISFERVNKIEYVTDQGSTTYDFTVLFPSLTVDGLDNEFANAGDSVLVRGANFDIYDFGNASKVAVNGTETGVGSVGKSSMKVLVPAGTPDNSAIVLTWSTSDGGRHTMELPFRPTKTLLYGDFDDVQKSVDGSVKCEVEGDEATSASSSLGHKHLHITGDFSAWAWNTIDLSCNMIDGIEVATPDDYVLKFEVLTPKDHQLSENSPLQFCFNWGDSYTWNPGEGYGLNTFGEWQTVTLPLSPMATKGISAARSWQTLRMVFQPKADYVADFRMGNFRIVRACPSRDRSSENCSY